MSPAPPFSLSFLSLPQPSSPFSLIFPLHISSILESDNTLQ